MSSLEERFAQGIIFVNFNIIEKCILEGVDPNCQISDDKATALHKAVELSHIPLIKKLFKCKNLNINPITSFGDTPLHIACYKEDYFMVEYLVLNGADLNFGNRFKKNALHIVATTKCISIASFLIHFGVHINALDDCENTPLSLAVESDNTVIVKLLLRSGADPNVVTKKPHLVLKLALEMQKKSQLDMFQLLYLHNLDIEVTDKNTKRNALHYAAMTNYLPLVLDLLYWGVSPDQKDCMGWTPYDIAKNHKSAESASLIKNFSRHKNEDDFIYYYQNMFMFYST